MMGIQHTKQCFIHEVFLKYIYFFSTIQIDLSKLTRSTGSDIYLLSISLNMQFVAIYLTNGELLITNTRFTELHSHIDLTQRISVMLVNNNNSANQKFNHPKTMLWLTNSAVVLQWNNLIAIISTQSDIYETFYADDIFLAQEVSNISYLCVWAICVSIDEAIFNLY